jgi:hypothetical protein
MSNKFIKFSIKNAKLFPKNEKTKDFVRVGVNKDKLIFTGESRTNIKNSSFKETITVHQISNVLHVLIGEKPVPSFRKTFMNEITLFFVS